MRKRLRERSGDSISDLRQYDEEMLRDEQPEMAIGDLRRQDNEYIQAQKPLSPEVRAALAKKNPGLIEEYNRRMGVEDINVAAAQKKQNIMGYADVIGQASEDYINSRREPVILENRFQDLGKEHNTIEPEKYRFDNSLANSMVDSEVARAKEGRAEAKNRYSTELQLGDHERKLEDRQTGLDAAAAKKDPNSDISRQSRDNLRMFAPDIDKRIPNFDSATAEQLERAAPMLMKRMEAEAADKRHRESMEWRKVQQGWQNQRRTEDERVGKPYEYTDADGNKRIGTYRKGSGLTQNPSDQITVPFKPSAEQAKQAGLVDAGNLANSQYEAAIEKGKSGGSLGDNYDPTDPLEFIDNSSLAPKWLKSSAAGDAETAQSAWVESFLRDASGAAIPQSERLSYAKDFFPRPGDSAQALADKKVRREQKEAAAKNAAGPAYKESAKQPPSFPKILRKEGKTATVNNESELKEAQSEGWQ